MNQSPNSRDGAYAGKQILLVGLGATGRSVLRYLSAQGAVLVVTDSRPAPNDVAELRAAYPLAEFHFDAFAVQRNLAEFDEAVISPGVSLQESFVQAISSAGVPLVGDIELFARAIARAPSPAKLVGITGSNGKSTVTTLLGRIATAAGFNTAVGGNIGTPALDLLDADADLYVLELSSFQLETTTSLKCQAAAYLNLSADHLDRHGTLENYGQIKSRIFKACQTAVVNRDDRATLEGSQQASKLASFGLDSAATGDFGVESIKGERCLMFGRQRICAQSDLKIQGLHNLSNALAALALANAVGIAPDACLGALSAFAGLPHRCEFVARKNGVNWLNDSKGTNVGSTLAALNGLDGPIVWLGGGQGKDQDFKPLRTPLSRKGRAALLFGQDARTIEQALVGAVSIYRDENLLGAMHSAKRLARPGDTVLLSPACASLDQFKNYAERGEQFSQWVRENA